MHQLHELITATLHGTLQQEGGVRAALDQPVREAGHTNATHLSLVCQARYKQTSQQSSFLFPSALNSRNQSISSTSPLVSEPGYETCTNWERSKRCSCNCKNQESKAGVHSLASAGDTSPLQRFVQQLAAGKGHALVRSACGNKEKALSKG